MKSHRKIIPDSNYSPNITTKKRLHEDEIDFDQLRSYRLNRVKKELAKRNIGAGKNWNQLLEILKPGGRYATSGAIAGPIVSLDVRTLYLKDLTFYGSTYQPVEVFKNLIRYIEKGEIKPLVAKTYPLKEIKKAQEDFLLKKHVGKLVLLP